MAASVKPTNAIVRNAAQRAKRNLPLSPAVHRRRLTFDMSGGRRGAKRPLARPLDGGVRRHLRRCWTRTWQRSQYRAGVPCV